MTSSESVKSLCSVTCEHIAACANKCPKCISWADNGLIAIGSGQSVVVCANQQKSEDKNFKSVLNTLNAHKGRVNCVCWIRSGSDFSESSGCFLLSGSADGTAIVWGCKKLDNATYAFDALTTLKGHEGAVTCMDGLIIQNQSTKARTYLVALTGIDATVKIWRNSSGCIKSLGLSQTLNLHPSIVLSVSLHALTKNAVILACGLDNSKIGLYTCSEDSTNKNSVVFSPAMSLVGHEDWVRDTGFVTLENGDILLATCSQDTFIRLWRIAPRCSLVDPISEIESLKVKEMKFEINQDEKVEYIVTLDAVLSGHEGWVYSVHWSMCKDEISSLRLLSSSMDKSIIIWKMDEESQIWIEEARFGEVGGNTLGFYGSRFNAKGTEVIAHSYNGALHLWENNGKNGWESGVIVSGHFGSVLDLSWEPEHGRYLVTTSSDQTTRLIAEWKCGNSKSWHEIARPQVHGYDMQCISMIDSFRFVSGADEKVLRVFEAPKTFLQNYETLSKIQINRETSGPEGATVPALGLSNKAVFTTNSPSEKETPTTRGEQYIENQFKKLLLNQPPSEEYLLQNSLWPETHKLYWHVFEIFCVAANSTGTLVASTAKSSSAQHSTIVLWNTRTWKEVAQLQGHTLTVTQIEFSPDGKYLLSVSRDRTWILHKITGSFDSGFSTSTYSKSEKILCHSRIIWSASWTHDNHYFCTGSRDKKVMLWKVGNQTAEEGDLPMAGNVERVYVSNFSEAITAVSFAKSHFNKCSYLVAIGKESGHLELSVLSLSPEYSLSMLKSFNIHESHATTVKRIKWRPAVDHADEHHFASCGTDHLVKLFSVKLNGIENEECME